ncbi:hypothetical protein WMY93_002890 [Mugilogobius chulae]|uniref:Uncharacterized protein n=1 Tax=Mugilogobius chulae TaxID=88201 RepID=A0AAW0PXU6_9GOBI
MKRGQGTGVSGSQGYFSPGSANPELNTQAQLRVISVDELPGLNKWVFEEPCASQMESSRPQPQGSGSDESVTLPMTVLQPGQEPDWACAAWESSPAVGGAFSKSCFHFLYSVEGSVAGGGTLLLILPGLYLDPRRTNTLRSHRSSSGALLGSHTHHSKGEYLALISSEHLANVKVCLCAEFLFTLGAWFSCGKLCEASESAGSWECFGAAF